MNKDAKQAKRHAGKMRVQGYQDGLSGRPAASADPHYLSSHRRGRERYNEIKGEGK
jgi:hypothetical protein